MSSEFSPHLCIRKFASFRFLVVLTVVLILGSSGCVYSNQKVIARLPTDWSESQVSNDNCTDLAGRYETFGLSGDPNRSKETSIGKESNDGTQRIPITYIFRMVGYVGPSPSNNYKLTFADSNEWIEFAFDSLNASTGNLKHRIDRNDASISCDKGKLSIRFTSRPRGNGETYVFEKYREIVLHINSNRDQIVSLIDYEESGDMLARAKRTEESHFRYRRVNPVQ